MKIKWKLLKIINVFCAEKSFLLNILSQNIILGNGRTSHFCLSLTQNITKLHLKQSRVLRETPGNTSVDCVSVKNIPIKLIKFGEGKMKEETQKHETSRKTLETQYSFIKSFIIIIVLL